MAPTIPAMDPEARPYFAAAAEARFSVPICNQCRRHHWYPAPACPYCGSGDISWSALSGRAEVQSFTVVEYVPAGEQPYILAVIEPADAPGVHILADIVDAIPQEMRIGMAVRAVFESAGPGLGLVHFAPATARRTTH
jgi:hypothetical protein